MTAKKRVPKYLSKEQLEKILSDHFGRKIETSARMEEDFSSWSGQVWDDGMLPEVFAGVYLEKKL